MTILPPALLGAAGPAQFELLIHFCGRPNLAASTPNVPQTIRDQPPWLRQYNILWEGQIRGFAPFGSDSPMVCLSESPLEHLSWLLANRQWPPWGLLLWRQAAYDLGGGPVWYARNEQLEKLPTELRSWTVRFDAGVNRSDWLHEREWRIPVPPNRASEVGCGQVSSFRQAHQLRRRFRRCRNFASGQPRRDQ